MVPFYGQGMNCGFEDLLVLNSILDKHVGTKGPTPELLETVLSEYSETRHKDAAAMCDLALHNYIEMRSSVVKFSYLIRKKVDALLNRICPAYKPLYTMVSFSQIPYSEVMRKWERQTAWLQTASYSIGILSFAGLLYGSLRLFRERPGLFTKYIDLCKKLVSF